MGLLKSQQLPHSIRMQLNIMRAKRHWNNVGIIFIHIPKNGGTSINQALYGRFMGHFSISEVELLHRRMTVKLPKIALSRNPWARLYSAYLFARRNSEEIKEPKIYNPNFFQNDIFSTFDKFVNEWLVYQNIRSLDLIFRPQIDFISRNDGSIGVDYVGRLEEPLNYTKWIEETLRHSINVSHLNKTGSALSYRKVYNKQLIETISQIYAEDLRVFNYDF